MQAVESALACWREPDQSIWEVRGEARHFTYSKVMCWVAADRGARLAALRGETKRAEDWWAVALEIHDDVCANGVDARGRFVQHYGGDELDASLLCLPLLRFLPADDERIRATVHGIADELGDGAFVSRYRTTATDDGIDGEPEGSFTVCSFWLVSALVEIGEVDRARTNCEKLISAASSLGSVRRGARPRHDAAPRELPPGPHAPVADQRGPACDRGGPAPRRAPEAPRGLGELVERGGQGGSARHDDVTTTQPARVEEGQLAGGPRHDRAPAAAPPSRASAPDAAAPLVVVANRLPVHRVDDAAGAEWRASPGGLAPALTAVLGRSGGSWVGWSGRVDDDATPPLAHDGIALHAVALSTKEYEDFYLGFSNATLWPLYHDAVRSPAFHREWWHAYEAMNDRFAEAAAAAVAPHGTVWVHDYQLQLVPRLLRERRPDVRIGFFLHIPFPPRELFMQLPWRRELLAGLLGADLVGFQLPAAAANFSRLARRLMGAREVRGSFASRDARCASGPSRSPSTPTTSSHVRRSRRRSHVRVRCATSSATPSSSCSGSTGSTTRRGSTSASVRSRSSATRARRPVAGRRGPDRGPHARGGRPLPRRAPPPRAGGG